MPTYDYACTSCGNRVEVMHGVNDPGPGACGRCGGAMRKLLSAPTIVFKGTGWAKKERATTPAAKTGDKKDGASADSAAPDNAPGGAHKQADAGAAKPKTETSTGSSTGTGSSGSDAP